MTHLAMALSPIAALFLMVGRPLALGIPMTLVAGYLLLPAGFGYNLPALPPLAKASVPVLLCFLFGLLIYASRSGASAQRGDATIPEDPITPGWIPAVPYVRICFALLFVGAFGTWLTNSSAVFVGETVLRGLSVIDALSRVQTVLMMFLSLFLGWKFMGSEASHRRLLVVLAVAGLILSLPTMAEVRLSPQFHNWVYGYFPHSWQQHTRADGFRPVVFMQHALELAIVLCVGTLALLAYMRSIDGDRRVLYLAAALWMAVVLVLSKSIGVLLIATAMTPVLLWANARLQLYAAAAVALLVLCYPLVRAVGLNPLSHLVDMVSSFAPDRARSLNFRLVNEAQVIERFLQQPIFGWGGWTRNEILDPETGHKLSTIDGVWLLHLSKNGFVGFIGGFGLLVFPILSLALGASRRPVPLATSGLAVVLAANLMDLIPNSGLSPITWLMAGALAGAVQMRRTLPQADRAEHAAGPSAATAREGSSTGIGGGAVPGAAVARDDSRPTRYSRFEARHSRSRARAPQG